MDRTADIRFSRSDTSVAFSIRRMCILLVLSLSSRHRSLTATETRALISVEVALHPGINALL